MKVLIACNHDSFPNPYVRTLAQGLQTQGIDITCSVEEFFAHPTAYDIVHIQWPNLLFDELHNSREQLCRSLTAIRQSKTVLVCTCHNIRPHYNAAAGINEAYRLVYTHCDYIQHLGSRSIALLQEAYPEMTAEHVIIPHHTYDHLYTFDVDAKAARQSLHIPTDKHVLLSFGEFRSNEERRLLIQLSRQLGSDYHILAPGFFFRKIWQPNPLKTVFNIVRTFFYNLWAASAHIHIAHHYITDEELPRYLAAADVLLIQRLHILNSGNVPLAMLAGLPIVGPDTGNVGSLLRETHNFVFPTADLSSLPLLVQKAVSHPKIGTDNRAYAEKNLTTDAIACKLAAFYRRIAPNH